MGALCAQKYAEQPWKLEGVSPLWLQLHISLLALFLFPSMIINWLIELYLKGSNKLVCSFLVEGHPQCLSVEPWASARAFFPEGEYYWGSLRSLSCETLVSTPQRSIWWHSRHTAIYLFDYVSSFSPFAAHSLECVSSGHLSEWYCQWSFI